MWCMRFFAFLFFSRIIDPFIDDLLNKVDRVDRDDHSEIEKEKERKKQKIIMTKARFYYP